MQSPDAPTGGRAIITAGVPGAGKSRALDAIAAGYRRIDPDEIKDMLLARLATAGLLEDRYQHVLADEHPVSPGELSGWVHVASTSAADRVRAASLQIGENFAMEGTLSWPPLSSSHVDELAVGGYEQLNILDIEVPFTVAIEQSKHRWWEGRHSGLTRNDIELGGRFLSEATLRGLYTGPQTASACATNARELFVNASDAGIHTDVLIVSRTATGMEHKAHLTSDGAVQAWGSAPLGAACTRCGGILTDRQAILHGVGRACAQKSAPT